MAPSVGSQAIAEATITIPIEILKQVSICKERREHLSLPTKKVETLEKAIVDSYNCAQYFAPYQ